VLELTVTLSESYDDATERFITEKATLQLEHSLLTVSKWESEFQKPFLVPGEKTAEEVLGYIRCMILTPDFSPEALAALARDADALTKIHEYWNANMTASSVPEDKNAKGSRERITSELIYYWMASMQIPFHPAETWHLSRLFMLIRIAGVKNAPPKKVSRGEAMANQKAENARRRAEAGSKG
jgi:hypothetical protein